VAAVRGPVGKPLPPARRPRSRHEPKVSLSSRVIPEHWPQARVTAETRADPNFCSARLWADSVVDREWPRLFHRAQDEVGLNVVDAWEGEDRVEVERLVGLDICNDDL
jgi:hypothetical protein